MPTTERDYGTDLARPVLDEATLDELMSRVQDQGLELLGPEGVLTALTSRIMNRALEAEMTDHLGYERGDPAGWGSGNNRNGSYPKTVLTDAGGVPVSVPRDRNGTFEPVVVQRRLSRFNDVICGLLGRGMSTRDICAQLSDTYGVEISAELVSKITDAVLPEVRAWQSRVLDPVYPILYLDAIVVKVRTDGRVTNRPCYLALCVNLDGEKHVLGMWLGDGKAGAKFWLSVCTELRNRGLDDVLIVCCDGLTGFPDAIKATWPLTESPWVPRSRPASCTSSATRFGSATTRTANPSPRLSRPSTPPPPSRPQPTLSTSSNLSGATATAGEAPWVR